MVPKGNFHELGKLGKDISAAALAQLTNQLGTLIHFCVVAIQLRTQKTKMCEEKKI